MTRSPSERAIAKWAHALRRAELGDPDALIALCTRQAPTPYGDEIRKVLMLAPWSVEVRQRNDEALASLKTFMRACREFRR